MCIIQTITKLNDEQQKYHLRFLTRVNIELRIEIFSAHKQLFYELKQNQKENISLSILSYAALILAIKNTMEEFDDTKNLNFDGLTQNEIKKISSKKAKLFLYKQYRVKSKSDKLLDYWSVVKVLKEQEGFSFRQIESYLKKKHKLDVAHVTIYNMWKKFENEKD